MRITVGYVLVWVVVVAVWLLIAFAWPDSEGPEFDWSGVAAASLAAVVALVGGHLVWATGAVNALRPQARPWRTAVTVLAPPVSLALIPIAVNESAVPWQLWPVALVVVPATGATWATARR